MAPRTFLCDVPRCCGDLRNVVKTVAGIPEDHKGQINIVINDEDFNTIARAFIILTYLLYHDDVAEATENAIHLWYSFCIPSSIDGWMRESLVEFVREEIRLNNKGSENENVDRLFWDELGLDCRGTVVRKELAPISISLDMPRQHWYRLEGYLLRESNWKMCKSARESIVLTENRRDYREQYLFRQPSRERPSHMAFKYDGILKPFGRELFYYNTPNLTLFDGSRGVYEWLIDDTKGPERGWSRSEFKKMSTGLAKNDILGKLYYYLQDLLSTFHARMRTLNIHFFLEYGPLHLMDQILKRKTFDRILLPEENLHPYIVADIAHWPSEFFNPRNHHATLITPIKLSSLGSMKLPTHDSRRHLGAILSNNPSVPLPRDLYTSAPLFNPRELILRETFSRNEECAQELMSPCLSKDVSYGFLFAKWDTNDNVRKKAVNDIVEMWPYLPDKYPSERNKDLICEDRYPTVKYVEWNGPLPPTGSC
ncbi:hypothetical protein F5Y11DRAFT_349589 [Daldinia sp. FL1419]|nr:hypothetical protein F5Y11DRAFT_349589 [Daldinia sp. FL1419]